MGVSIITDTRKKSGQIFTNQDTLLVIAQSVWNNIFIGIAISWLLRTSFTVW